MSKQTTGATGGFHYGTLEAPCNGVLHATDREHSDGRQIYVCDACGAECVRKPDPAREVLKMNNSFDTVYREGSIAYDAWELLRDAWLAAEIGTREYELIDSVRTYLYDRGDIAMAFCNLANNEDIPF
jgi:hypothetical protein